MMMMLLLFSLKGCDPIVGQWRKDPGIVEEGRGWSPAAVVCKSLVVIPGVVHDVEVAHLIFSVRPEHRYKGQ